MELYDWQKREVSEHGTELKRAIFAAPRLGKTLVTIESSARWEGADRLLVCCPLVVAPQWDATLKAEGYRTINLYSGSREARIKRLDELDRGHARASRPADRPPSRSSALGDRVWAIVNYDSLATAGTGWDALIGDESHYIKGVSTGRAKAFRRLAWRTKWTRLLTGTPSPNHYGDLWGQLSALDKGYWGSYESFARRYLIRDRTYTSRVLGHINVRELQQRLLRFATIVRREDVFGPDQWHVVHRSVGLPPEARRVYDVLAKQWIFEEGRNLVETAHILKRMVRLQQLAAGFLPNEDGTYAVVHSAKTGAVEADLIDIVASNEKAVIFHRFRWESEAYTKVAESLGCLVITINGDTSPEQREADRLAFQAHDGAAIAVLQIQSAGIGVSFSTAQHALFASRGFSYTEDEQALARIYSPGEVRVATYYESDRTIDTYIRGVLDMKRNVHDSVINADRRAMAWGMLK